MNCFQLALSPNRLANRTVFLHSKLYPILILPAAASLRRCCLSPLLLLPPSAAAASAAAAFAAAASAVAVFAVAACFARCPCECMLTVIYIVVAKEAPGPLTPQASKGKGKRKRAPTAVVSGAMPDWASPGRRGDSKHCRLARDILGELSMTFPAGSGCSDCVARSCLCVVGEDRTKCASCSAQGAGSVTGPVRESALPPRTRCKYIFCSVHSKLTFGRTIRPRVSQAGTTKAAPAARVQPPATTGTVRRPSPWTSA